MISVASRDGKKGLSSMYGGEMELESEIEEGEACLQNNNGDDSQIDLDASFSYIVEKIQDVLGDYQKEFEGGVSAENLGAKFGEYGSFLPTYQRSPVWPHPKTPQKVLTYNAHITPNNAHLEKSVSQAANSNGQHVIEGSDQKSLKVRIKVGSEPTRKNADIYSGLGLDASPSSSMEASPVNSDGFFHEPRDGPDESPTSILEVMTSFPVCGSLLLSPLPYHVLHLTDGSCGPVHKGSQESTVTALHGSDSGKLEGKKPDDDLTDIAKEEPLDRVSLTKDEKKSVFAIKADSNASNGSKTRDISSSRDEKKSKNGSRGLKKDSSSTSKSKKTNGKAIETYKEFFGELDLGQEDDDGSAFEKPSGVEKGTLESNGSSKERSIGTKSQKPSLLVNARPGSYAVPTAGNGSVSGLAGAPVAPLVNEDWVCCDKCEKWRLLPPGVNPGSLPEKWLCSMLDWLPGMNRCSIGEEETTKAITSRFPGPPMAQGSQPVPIPVHPGAPCLDQTHQLLGSQAPSSKKRHEAQDLLNEPKPERPSLSSNSAKKHLQTSYKSKSLNGPSVNDVEFQDSGRSSDVIAEKRRSKHKENDNHDNDNNNHSKISNKRDPIHEYPRNGKKIKTDEDCASDHGGLRKDRWKHGERPNDTKSGSRVSARNTENRNQTGSKRKANEFAEETSETDYKKEKKSRVLKSREDEIHPSKANGKTSLDVIAPVHATSSSSKVSGSRKTKADNRGSKGSPGESVSSSPLRVLNREKVTSSRRNKVNPKTSGSLNKNGSASNSKTKMDFGIKTKSSQDLKQSSSSKRGKSHSLPPSGNVALKGPKQNKKTQNPKGNQPMNVKHPAPEMRKDAPSPPKRATSNQIATNALREATNLKHMADRVKNGGSSLESRALYMQAALKFLHVGSLFESCHAQTGRFGDMIQSMSIYGSTAKLCEFCAHEYEKSKETAIAALAYKCMEVAYLKVVYSSHNSACKDLHELQATLHIGESPSSSASVSDLDNLNNPATLEKAALAKGVHSPQVAGNHVIAAKNKPNFTRILNFAQDANLAMEASRKSRIAFAASGLRDETGLSAIKTALDFNFHDVEELLRLVRLAMELINR